MTESQIAPPDIEIGQKEVSAAVAAPQMGAARPAAVPAQPACRPWVPLLLALILVPAGLILPFVIYANQAVSAVVQRPAAWSWWAFGLFSLLAYPLARAGRCRLSRFLALSALSGILLQTAYFAFESSDAFLVLLPPLALANAFLLKPVDSLKLIAAQIAAAVAVILAPAVAAGDVVGFSPQFSQAGAFGLLASAGLLLMLLLLVLRQFLADIRQRNRRRKSAGSLGKDTNDLADVNRKLALRSRQLREEMAIRRRTEEQLTAATRQLSSLNRIVSATTSTLDSSALLKITCDELADVLEIESALALLWQDDRQTLQIAAANSGAGRGDLVGRRLASPDSGLAGYLADSRQTLFIENAAADARPLTEADAAILGAAGAWLFRPMTAGDELLGVLALAAAKPGRFLQQDADLAKSVAAAASQSLYDARLLAAESKQRALAEALRDTTAVLTSSLNVEEVLDRILTNVGNVVAHDSANIMLAGSSAAQIVRQKGYQKRGSRPWHKSKRFVIDEVPLLKTMRDTLEPVCVPDTRSSDEWVLYPQANWIGSYLAAPIRSQGEVIGFINLNSATPNEFTPEHARHLLSFADQAAVTIGNARLHQKVELYAASLEQRVAERTAELEEANRYLRALARVKDEFVSNISHELRTPITNLLLRHDLIMRQPEQLAKHMDVIHRETIRLHRIIEDLLQLSRLDRDQVELSRTSVDINEMVQRYISDREPMAREKGIELTAELGDKIPLVDGDEQLLGQVVSILLTNALTFSPEGSRIATRTFFANGETAPMVVVEVADNGPGIPAAEQAQVFDRFFRGELALEANAPGTGLGLAIAREIVSRHNGEIGLESSGVPGEGATFTVSIPCLPAEYPSPDLEAFQAVSEI